MCNCAALTLVTGVSAAFNADLSLSCNFRRLSFLSHLHHWYSFLLRIYPTFVYLAPFCLTFIIVIFVCCSSPPPLSPYCHNQRGTCLLYICQPFAASTRSLSLLKARMLKLRTLLNVSLFVKMILDILINTKEYQNKRSKYLF